MSRIINRRVWCHLVALILASCSAPPSEAELIDNPFPREQAELRKVIDGIAKDAMEANIEGLQDAHLHSEKFTKFGPRSFDRQDVAATDQSEAAFFSSIKNLDYQITELKIDVFGKIAVATYYPHVSFIKDGEEKRLTGRQTFVFLKTVEGWKLVHEHGTIRQ